MNRGTQKRRSKQRDEQANGKNRRTNEQTDGHTAVMSITFLDKVED